MTMQNEPQKGIMFSTAVGQIIALGCNDRGSEYRVALRLLSASR